MTEDRLMIFIDGQNLMHDASNLGEQVDATKLVEMLSEGRKLRRAYYYGFIPPNPDNDAALKLQIDRQMAYYHSREYSGFKTTIIPLRKKNVTVQCENCGRTTTKERSIEKGVDVALASDLLSLAAVGAYDIATIVSGDLDFLFQKTYI
jgi:uncharacterized LabA/DUF88 family protein